jgi:hypothetical protein
VNEARTFLILLEARPKSLTDELIFSLDAAERESM